MLQGPALRKRTKIASAFKREERRKREEESESWKEIKREGFTILCYPFFECIFPLVVVTRLGKRRGDPTTVKRISSSCDIVIIQDDCSKRTVRAGYDRPYTRAVETYSPAAIIYKHGGEHVRA